MAMVVDLEVLVGAVAIGATEADVTEGSGGVWERQHYDWSDPSRVVVKTTDSNAWGGDSSHTYTFTRNPDGTTDIDYRQQVQRYFDDVDRFLGGGEGARQPAILAVSALVGAIVLSRAVDDEALADEILGAGRQGIGKLR